MGSKISTAAKVSIYSMLSNHSKVAKVGKSQLLGKRITVHFFINDQNNSSSLLESVSYSSVPKTLQFIELGSINITLFFVAK